MTADRAWCDVEEMTCQFRTQVIGISGAGLDTVIGG
jgi:hypothetical protein